MHTLNLGLHIVDGIRRLHLEGDSLTCEGLDEDLHDGLAMVSTEKRGQRLRGESAYLDNQVSSSVVDAESLLEESASGCNCSNLNVGLD